MPSLNHEQMKKYIVFLGLLACFGSCKNEPHKKKATQKSEEINFSDVNLDISDFKDCPPGTPCPKLEIDYLKAKGTSSISKSINKNNSAHLVQIFNTAEDTVTKETVREAAKGFVTDFFNFKKDFPDSEAGYEADITQKVLDANEKTIVLETNSYMFTGGAHGYSATNFQNFDAKTGKLLSHRELFSNLSAFRKYTEQKFRKKYKIGNKENINSKGFFFENDTFALPNNIAVTSEEVILVYNPYEAASYAQGALKFVFPRKEVAQWLRY